MRITSCFLIGFKSWSRGWNPCLVTSSGQEPTAGQVKAPGEETSTILLLSWYSIRLTSNGLLLYPYTNAYFTPHQKGSICARWWLTQRTTTGQEQKIKDFKILSPKSNTPHLLLPKLRGKLAKKGERNYESQGWWVTTRSSAFWT